MTSPSTAEVEQSGSDRGSRTAALLAPAGVIPVCRLRSPSEAHPLADALVAGGLPLVEVTLRTPDALNGLEAIAGRSDITVGAGTVRTPQQLRDAVAASARFVVSPCLTDALAETAHELDVPFLPGVATGSEIQRAVDAGFPIVKFFPAESCGGLAALSALAEPFSDVRFVPTGGIDVRTAATYLDHPSVLAVGGSWMLPEPLRAAGDWAAVRDLIAAATTLARPQVTA
jgi:2-dehydro-3-deoxyphosphogluconate aldolase/(4S)-4-hydroxy-2-oxoglutarate aldolase